MSLGLYPLLLAAFFLGAVPFGLIVARLCGGVDLRATGSGNIGATNVARTLGLKFGVLTLALDVAKGLAAVLAAQALFPQAGPATALAAALAGLAVFLGHLFSPFLGFKGGKGVATALGVYLGLAPLAVLPALAVFVAVVARWGFVSAGSMSGAVSVPVAACLLGYPPSAWGLALVMAALIVWRHRENLGRLIRREEKPWRRR